MIKVNDSDVKIQSEVFNPEIFQVGDLIQFNKKVSSLEKDTNEEITLYAIISGIDDERLNVYVPDREKNGIKYLEMAIEEFTDITNIIILNRDEKIIEDNTYSNINSEIVEE